MINHDFVLHKKKIKIRMTEGQGWKKSSYPGMTIWFKGYLSGEHSLESIQEQLDLFCMKRGTTIVEFSNWIKEIQGHFALVVKTKDWCFLTVDKICSIPLFYTQVDNKVVVSNRAPLLKNLSNFGYKDLNYDAALEIAMSAYTIGNKTLYKGLCKLTAGECLLVNKEKIEKYFYYTYSPWHVKNRSKARLKLELTDCLLETFEDLIRNADGRQIVIPLSAGNDSRLVASCLKYIGYKNVHCFAYGDYRHYESKTSKFVAEKLGYSWTHVPLSRKIQKDFFSSVEFNNFLKQTDTLSSVSHVQEVNAIDLLKKSGKISQGAVFVNGNTGDFISGGHIPPSLKPEGVDFNNINNIVSDSWSDFIKKHYSLWGVLKSEENNRYIKDVLLKTIEQRACVNIQDINQTHGFFECLEYLGRQSSYIVNMQRAYEFHDYGWRMPLWSDQMLDFWSEVPRIHKVDQNLYNVNPLLFEKYNESDIIESIEKYGWERPQDVDTCSSNCLMNKVGNYYHNKLYGYHPYQYEVSSLIRIGSISIDEGRKMLSDVLMDKGGEQIARKICS